MEEFFRDYGTPFGALVAVLNTVISITIGQFFKENNTAKVILIAGSALFGAIAVGATFYSQHLIVADRDAQTVRQKHIREQLGKFIEEGNVLKVRCQDSTLPRPLADANDWKRRTETFLETELGHSYVIRFRDRTGIFQSEILMKGDDEHVNMWSTLYYFIVRLEQFSEQPVF